MSRLENQISKEELDVIRRFFVDKFIRGYKQAPQEILLDIDAWDAQTHGHQQLSLFHGYSEKPSQFYAEKLASGTGRVEWT